MKMSTEAYEKLKKRRTQMNARLGYPSGRGMKKPKPMVKPEIVQEEEQLGLGLDLDQPDFGLEGYQEQPPRMEVLYVPYMGPSLNKIYAGVHWAERNKQAEEGHGACMYLEVEPFTRPVSIIFIPVVGKGARARDCSNYSYAAKIVEDGLVKTGILKDDSPTYVKSFTIEEPVYDRTKDSGMKVILIELSESLKPELNIKKQLPPSLKIVSNSVSEHSALTLMDLFPGHRLYVPQNPAEDHVLANVLEPTEFKRLTEVYGGSYIEIPACSAIRNRQRDTVIFHQFLDGESPDDIAHHFGLSKRQVRRVLKSCFEEKGQWVT